MNHSHQWWKFPIPLRWCLFLPKALLGLTRLWCHSLDGGKERPKELLRWTWDLLSTQGTQNHRQCRNRTACLLLHTHTHTHVLEAQEKLTWHLDSKFRYASKGSENGAINPASTLCSFCFLLVVGQLWGRQALGEKILASWFKKYICGARQTRTHSPTRLPHFPPLSLPVVGIDLTVDIDLLFSHTHASSF